MCEMKNNIPDDVFSKLDPILAGEGPKKTYKSTGLVNIPKAPNAIKFIEDPNFLNGPKLYPAQFDVIRDFCELLCPECNDVEAVHRGEIPREDQILYEHDQCPLCLRKKYEHVDELNLYNELVGVVGMRSGKSVMIACLSAWFIHELLCIEDLQKRLEVMETQYFDISFVASSQKQTSETIYGNFSTLYSESPWFQSYARNLETIEKDINSPYSQFDLYKKTETMIVFKEKKLRIQALAANANAAAGKTRYLSIMDELGRFDQGASKMSAREMYRSLKRALRTLHSSVERLREKGIYDIPEAKMLAISSPMFDDDMIMQLYRESYTSTKMYGFKKPTWEFNPTVKREDLIDEYERDPVGADRDYGANPPGSANPFVLNQNFIESSIDEGRKNVFTYVDRFFDQDVKGYMFNYVDVALQNVNYGNLHDYVIHCDPGKNRDSFCLSMGHLENIPGVGQSVVVIDGAIEWRPIPKNNRWKMVPREVYFPGVINIIEYLNNRISLKYVSYDLWNSAEHLQNLRDMNIVAISKTISRSDSVKFLNSMMSGMVRFPDRENKNMDPYVERNLPCAKALKELKNLSDNGIRVDHPPGGSNDMIQCYIGVHRLLTDPSITEDLEKAHSRKRSQLERRPYGRAIRLSPKKPF